MASSPCQRLNPFQRGREENTESHVETTEPALDAYTQPMRDRDTPCTVCCHINLYDILENASLSTAGHCVLPKLEHMKENTTCALCRLIFRGLLIKYPKLQIASEITGDCYIDLDRVDNNAQVLKSRKNRCARKIHVIVRNSHPLEFATLDFRLLSSHAPPSWPPENARKLSPRADIEYINRWLDTCTKYYGDACNSTDRDFRQWRHVRHMFQDRRWIGKCCDDPKCWGPIRRSLVNRYFDDTIPSVESSDSSMPLKLIDTYSRKIVFPTELVAYAALSYVWGNVSRIYVNKDNFSTDSNEIHLAPLPSYLPRTFEDALTLTISLRLRYLWVDALCICQDDEDEKSHEISRMDMIYSQAYITFIAADGPDVNYGLPRIKTDAWSSSQASETIQGKIYVTNMPSVYDLYKAWPWNRRTWTYQEAVLSRRCLYVTNQEVLLECCDHHYRESIEEPLDDTEEKEAMRFIQFIDLVNLQTVEPSRPTISMHQKIANRDITCPRDKLDAFTGMQKQLSLAMEIRFICGLPVALLAPALLWIDWKAKERIEEFPSWSWVGWRRNSTANDGKHGLWNNERHANCVQTFKLVNATNISLDIETWTADFKFVHQDIRPYVYSPRLISAFVPLSHDSRDVIHQKYSRFAMNLTQEEMVSFHDCYFSCVYIASYENTTDNGGIFSYTPNEHGTTWIWSLVLKVEQGVATRIGVVMIPEEDWNLANPEWRSWTIN